MTTLYVCGPMSGYPGQNKDAFQIAAELLRGSGYEVIDPAPYERAMWVWTDYLRRDLPLLLDCDGVATLDNWQCSKGAVLEVHVAQALSMPVLPVEVWVNKP